MEYEYYLHHFTEEETKVYGELKQFAPGYRAGKYWCYDSKSGSEMLTPTTPSPSIVNQQECLGSYHRALLTAPKASKLRATI